MIYDENNRINRPWIKMKVWVPIGDFVLTKNFVTKRELKDRRAEDKTADQFDEKSKQFARD